MAVVLFVSSAAFAGCNALSRETDAQPDSVAADLGVPVAKQARTEELAAEEDAERALLEIYFFAYGAQFGASPDDVDNVDIVAASSVLDADTSPRGPERRRLAATVLAGSSSRQGGQVEDWNPRSAGEALQRLGVPLGALAKALPEDTRSDFALQQRRESKTRSFLDLLSKVERFGTSSPCCACVEEWDVDPRTPSGSAKVYFKIRLPRPVDEVARTLDPERWDDCNREYFPDVFTTKSVSCDAPSQMRLPQPHAPGTTWEGIVHETFLLLLPKTEKDECKSPRVEFVNLLRIDADMQQSSATRPASYTMEYALCGGGSLASTVVCEKKAGGIEQDCGYCFVDRDSGTGTIAVQCVKLLRYDAQIREALDPWIGTGLKKLIDQTSTRALCCAHASDGPAPAPCQCDTERRVSVDVTCKAPRP